MDEAIGGKANIDPVAIVTMRAKLPGESSTERSSIPPTTSNGEIDDELLLKDPDLKGIKSSKRKRRLSEKEAGIIQLMQQKWREDKEERERIAEQLEQEREAREVRESKREKRDDDMVKLFKIATEAFVRMVDKS